MHHIEKMCDKPNAHDVIVVVVVIVLLYPPSFLLAYGVNYYYNSFGYNMNTCCPKFINNCSFDMQLLCCDKHLSACHLYALVTILILIFIMMIAKCILLPLIVKNNDERTSINTHRDNIEMLIINV